EDRQRALASGPSPNGPRIGSAPAPLPAAQAPSRSDPEPPPKTAQASASKHEPPQISETPGSSPISAAPSNTTSAAQTPDNRHDERLRAHIVSPASTTERLQSIQRLVADQTGDALPDFESNVLRAIPVQAGALFPISHVSYIE